MTKDTKTALSMETILNNFETFADFKKEYTSVLEKYKVRDRKLYDEEMPLDGKLDIFEELHLDHLMFGTTQDLDNIGDFARYKKVKITKFNNKIICLDNVTGFICASANKRVVLQTVYGFFGWVNLCDVEILNFSSTNNKHLKWDN